MPAQNGLSPQEPSCAYAQPNFVNGGYDKDYVRSSPFGAGATPEAINAAKTAMQAMKNGDAIFVGPIRQYGQAAEGPSAPMPTNFSGPII